MLFDPTPRPWAELVFHVLSHVEAGRGLPPSLYDSDYLRWVAARLGPAGERALAEDAKALGRSLASDEDLTAVQLLAWRFESIEQAGAAGELAPRFEPLRRAALRERDAHARLPRPTPKASEVERSLLDVAAAAPALARSRVVHLCVLGLRGRVRRNEIWVGAVDAERGVSVEHAAWQAAHEATVSELGPELASAHVEHAAIVLLAERAERAGLAAAHARWLAHFGEHAPPLGLRALGEAARDVVTRLLQSTTSR